MISCVYIIHFIDILYLLVHVLCSTIKNNISTSNFKCTYFLQALLRTSTYSKRQNQIVCALADCAPHTHKYRHLQCISMRSSAHHPSEAFIYIYIYVKEWCRWCARKCHRARKNRKHCSFALTFNISEDTRCTTWQYKSSKNPTTSRSSSNVCDVVVLWVCIVIYTHNYTYCLKSAIVRPRSRNPRCLSAIRSKGWNIDGG